jgi:thiamine biosynthesis lipoprotein
MAVAIEALGVRRVEQIMGMPIVVDVGDDDVDEGALDAVFDWFRAVDETFSTHKEDSEVSRLARGELAVADAAAQVQQVLARCEELRRETGGYFDAHASGTLDPSGFVKGWSVDRAADPLARAGFRNYALNAGGDIRLVGGARPDPIWRVGIQHPRLRDCVAAVVEGSDLAVATSGAYARGARPRSAHPTTAAGHPLGHDHRSGARNRRCIRYGRLCDGRRACTRLDGITPAGLRGDDDPRRRARADHAGLSTHSRSVSRRRGCAPFRAVLSPPGGRDRDGARAEPADRRPRGGADGT